MYCKICGTEFEGKFCPKCGTPAASVSAANTPAASNLTSNGTAETPAAAETGNKKYRTTVKTLLVVGLICFFFPFVTVSCADESVNISGFDALSGTYSDDGDNYDGDDYDANIALIAAFALGLVGFGFAWKKGKLKIPAITSLAGAIALILFRLTFYSVYVGDDADLLDLIKDCVEFRWGWWLSLLCYLAAAVIAFLSFGVSGGNLSGKLHGQGSTTDQSP